MPATHHRAPNVSERFRETASHIPEADPEGRRRTTDTLTGHPHALNRQWHSRRGTRGRGGERPGGGAGWKSHRVPVPVIAPYSRTRACRLVRARGDFLADAGKAT